MNHLAILERPTGAITPVSVLLIVAFALVAVAAVAWLTGAHRLLSPAMALIRPYTPPRMGVQLLCAGCGAMPLTMLSVSYTNVLPLALVFGLVVVPSYLFLLVVGMRDRVLGRRIMVGFAGGVAAVLVYDVIRLALAFSQGINDPIPNIGPLLLGGSQPWWDGYLWRTFGNGAGLGVCYVMLTPRRWFGALSGLVFGTGVALSCIAFLTVWPQAQVHIFQLSTPVIVNAMIGHWTFGLTLGALVKVGARARAGRGKHVDKWKNLATRHRRDARAYHAARPKHRREYTREQPPAARPHTIPIPDAPPGATTFHRSLAGYLSNCQRNERYTMKHRKTTRKTRVGVAMFAAAALPLGVLVMAHGPNEHASPKAAAAQAATHGKSGQAHGKSDLNANTKVKNPTCVLAVPKNPDTAAGLASAWVLNSGNTVCSVANSATTVVVTATITDAAGAVTTFNPPVIDEGTVAPVVTPPVLAAGSKVTLSVSFAGERLKLVGAGHKTPIKVTNGVVAP